MKQGYVVFAAAALLGVSAFASAANATVKTLTDFSFAATSAIGVVPPGVLLTAHTIATKSWIAVDVPISLGGLAFGGPVDVSSPITLTVGSKISLSWDGGVYHDFLTIDAINANPATETLSVDATGVLGGPGVPSKNTSTLDLAYTQTGGAHHPISGSGTYTDTTTIPEPATWAMFTIGFTSLGLLGLRGRRKSQRYAF
jgi:hypothetical protein